MRSRAANWAVDLSPVLQGTAAATVAWLIADRFVGNTDPFFAPIAAVIALNAPLGERASPSCAASRSTPPSGRRRLSWPPAGARTRHAASTVGLKAEAAAAEALIRSGGVT